MKTENKNFLYNVVYQMLIYIFPLITIPYISRVLGVDNIGIYSYTYSIVYCFMLVAMLGINNYGNRSISRVRDDPKLLSKTFFSIYFLQLILSIIMCIVYTCYVFFFCKEYKFIFYIHLIHLLSVCFDINWFFFGLEKFKMTIRRNLFIKIFSLILIFLFVKKTEDLWIYTFIMAFATLLSQLYLVFKIPFYVHYEKVKIKEVFNHLKSCIILFIPVLAYGIYRVMDKTMLGRISSVTELGYYENAEKLINIPISVITALGTVMLPHMSYLLKDNNSEYKQKIWESMKLVLILSVTMAFGLVLVARDASIILFGREFTKSGLIIQLLSITIIASAWANVIRTQYLIPKNQDKIYIFSTLGGAIINFVCNLLFIGKFGAFGACIGTVLAEVFVMTYQCIYTKDVLEMKRYFLFLLKALGKGSLMIGVAYLLTFFISNMYIRFVLQIIICIIMFLFTYYDYILHEFLNVNQKKKGG